MWTADFVVIVPSGKWESWFTPASLLKIDLEHFFPKLLLYFPSQPRNSNGEKYLYVHTKYSQSLIKFIYTIKQDLHLIILH